MHEWFSVDFARAESASTKKTEKSKRQDVTSNKRNKGKEKVETSDSDNITEKQVELFNEQQEKLIQLFEQYKNHKSELECQEALSNISGGFNRCSCNSIYFW